jgi:hypothetical protein
MELRPGQLWKDELGHARICGVVPVEGADYVVMLRTRGAGGRKRRPFLFPVASLWAGDDGWHLVEEPAIEAPASNEGRRRATERQSDASCNRHF